MAEELEAFKIRNEKFVQEADVAIPDVDVIAVQAAIDILEGYKKRALEQLEVTEEPEDDTEDVVTAVSFRIEKGVLLVRVCQALID